MCARFSAQAAPAMSRDELKTGMPHTLATRSVDRKASACLNKEAALGLLRGTPAPEPRPPDAGTPGVPGDGPSLRGPRARATRGGLGRGGWISARPLPPRRGGRPVRAAAAGGIRRRARRRLPAHAGLLRRTGPVRLRRGARLADVAFDRRAADRCARFAGPAAPHAAAHSVRRMDRGTGDHRAVRRLRRGCAADDGAA